MGRDRIGEGIRGKMEGTTNTEGLLKAIWKPTIVEAS